MLLAETLSVRNQPGREPPRQKQMACGVQSFRCSRNGGVTSVTGTVGEVRMTPQEVREVRQGVRRSLSYQPPGPG